MTDKNEILLYITQTQTGSFLAASNASPFFCVEAETEDAVKRKAGNALRYYNRAVIGIAHKTSETINFDSFPAGKVIRSSELVAA